MKRHKTDICIVGGGPAGSTLAHFLAQYQIPHIVVDKAVFPREKVCGDGLTLEVMETLGRISPELLANFLDNPEFLACWNLEFKAPNGRMISVHFPKEQLRYAPLYTGTRVTFDAFLLNNLSPEWTQTMLGQPVKRIHRETDGIRVFLRNEEEIEAKVVVGADGISSIVGRSLLPPSPGKPQAYGVGIRAYMKIPNSESIDSSMKFYFNKPLLPGYFWSFPLVQKKYNLGIYIPARRLKQQKRKLLAMWETEFRHFISVLQGNGALELDPLPVSWGLPLYHRNKPIVGPGVLLVGDAASRIEPFTGKGIGMAMLSSKIAAQYIQKAYGQGEYCMNTLMEYQAALNYMYRTEYNISQKLFQAFKNPVLANLIGWGIDQSSVKKFLLRRLSNEIAKWQC